MTYPLPIAGQTAEPVVLIDPATNQPYAAGQGSLSGLGNTNDAVATSDTGTFSLIALFKRALGYLATLTADTSPASTTSLIQWVDFTFTTDTAIYANGDVLVATVALPLAVYANDAKAVLQSITLLDEDHQGVAMDIYFLDANNSMGAVNAAFQPTDANARGITGYLSIAAADWKDLTGSFIVTKTNTGVGVKPATGTQNVYVAIELKSGTPTFTAAGLKGRFCFVS